MAKRLGTGAGTGNRSRPTKAAAEASAAAAELQTLHPQYELAFGDRLVVIREYAYLEELRLYAPSQPFVDDLEALLANATVAPSVDAIADVIARHLPLVTDLVARAAVPYSSDPTEMASRIGYAVQWIDGLGKTDGDRLVLCWWGLNGRFFFQRAFRKAAQTLAGRDKGTDSPLDTAGSTQP